MEAGVNGAPTAVAVLLVEAGRKAGLDLVTNLLHCMAGEIAQDLIRTLLIAMETVVQVLQENNKFMFELNP